MDDTLYLFVGKSASGKTSAARLLEERYGHKQVSSYTTRPPRYEGEIGHTFILDSTFDTLMDTGGVVAYTEYNGFRYCTTLDQLNESTIYVIDPFGVQTLFKSLRNLDATSRPIRVIYFDAAVSTRIDRMVERGDSDMQIISRLHSDDTPDDWYRQLDKLVWKYKNIDFGNVELYRINANTDIEDVLEQILYYMKKNESE